MFLFLLGLLFIIFWPQPGHTQDKLIEPLVEIVVEESLRAGLFPEVVSALILQETKFNPYALHISVPARIRIGWKLAKEKISYSFYRRQGRNHYVILSCTRPKAERILRWLVKRVPKADYDVGLMQVNRLKIKDLGLKPWDLLDPRTNVKAGVSILSRCLERSGSLWSALECYHRGENYKGGKLCNREPCSRYGLEIAKNLRKLLNES